MTLREAMRISAWHFVTPGERVQEVFGAQTAPPPGVPLLGSLATTLVNEYRIVAVTQQRILVLNCGRFTMKKAHSVVESLPRSTQLGPCSGTWHCITTPAETLLVHRRFFADLEAADRSELYF